VREVTLLGQNVNAYRGAMDDDDEPADLALLIEAIADMPGIERIRYTTSHPREMTQRLIDVYAARRSWSRTCTCRCSRVPTASWRR
jgi:tRNA-2-methylthio-N6-dimethylallyladenosine synthase